MEKNPALQGFTLLETAIVLVIVGLLVGGILVAKNLIRAAELRAVSAEAQGYITNGVSL
jgi:prepilin-type N-terminal cleavage/methylation domain-containing protein